MLHPQGNTWKNHGTNRNTLGNNLENGKHGTLKHVNMFFVGKMDTWKLEKLETYSFLKDGKMELKLFLKIKM